MNYEELEDFIRNKMSMTHVYQPLMIKKILESGNTAPKEAIARVFLNNDHSLLKYYKNTVMRWPKITLTNRKVISYKKGIFKLLLEGDVTDQQKKRLIELCDLRTEEYVEKYNKRWGVKTAREPIPSSLRYNTLAKSKGVCAACGSPSTKGIIEVDHILPVNMGGKTEAVNLQALCRKCNAQKSDRDKTDFVNWHKRLKHRDPNCVLCKSVQIESNELAFSAYDSDPITRLHSLIMPKRHTLSFFDLIPAEKNHCMSMVDQTKSQIQKDDVEVTGFNVGFDSGCVVGRQVMHCHIHVIPRRSGDSASVLRGMGKII